MLDDGRVVEQGTHEELMARDGMYHRFWQERQKARSWKLGSADAAATVGMLSGEDVLETIAVG